MPLYSKLMSRMIRMNELIDQSEIVSVSLFLLDKNDEKESVPQAGRGPSLFGHQKNHILRTQHQTLVCVMEWCFILCVCFFVFCVVSRLPSSPVVNFILCIRTTDNDNQILDSVDHSSILPN